MKGVRHVILKLPIRYKISIIMIVILFTSITLISSLLFNKEKAILLSEMKKRGSVLSKNLANAGFEAIINKDKLISSDIIIEIMKDQDIIYCMILNNRNRVIDSSVPEEINKTLRDEYTRSISKLDELTIINQEHDGQEVLDIIRPIFIEYKHKKIKKGYIRIGMGWDIINAEIKKAQTYTIFLAFFFLVIGVTISLVFAKTITDPILKIVRVMEKVGQGDLEQRVDISLIDEIGKLAGAFNEMIQHLKEKLMMAKYVSKSTMEMISHKDDSKLELGGRRKTVTLFFSDIRGFTSYSESKTPEQVITMLNKFLSIQAEIIDKTGGSVDKFVGDEVVAVYEKGNMVENAIKSSVLIQRKILDLIHKGEDEIAIGIGINTGEVVMGNMGSEKRMDYTVIGDTVNTASRLCSNAMAGQIIISESAYLQVKGKFKFKRPIEISVKGKKEPIKVYEVIY
ncbi:MAG: adenylate/guanylate cyclase domain-containing protein [bacterium]|nr:adenylate/guanylate cyclase domain-containing protein [bacterium]